MNIDFSELDKLEIMLKKANIPYERYASALIGQIFYPSKNKRVSDVIILYVYSDKLGLTSTSYGAPLLEQMGLVDENAVGDIVEGGLTAETVFERWKNHYEEHKNDYKKR